MHYLLQCGSNAERGEAGIEFNGGRDDPYVSATWLFHQSPLISYHHLSPTPHPLTLHTPNHFLLMTAALQDLTLKAACHWVVNLILRIVSLCLPLTLRIVSLCLPLILRIVSLCLPLILRIVSLCLPLILRIVSLCLPLILRMVSLCLPLILLMVSLCLPLIKPPRWPSGKASASRAEGPGFESRLRRDFFGVESYQ